MRLLIALALVSGAAMAQDLPPIGTYHKGELAKPAWPDPAKLSPEDRVGMEILLRSAHARKAEAAAEEASIQRGRDQVEAEYQRRAAEVRKASTAR